jgi:hypothetical protein
LLRQLRAFTYFQVYGFARQVLLKALLHRRILKVGTLELPAQGAPAGIKIYEHIFARLAGFRYCYLQREALFKKQYLNGY